MFIAEDGERVTLVTFADRDSHDAWGRHPEHREAQRAGVRDYYEEYSISVGTVDRARAWVRDGGWGLGVIRPTPPDSSRLRAHGRLDDRQGGRQECRHFP